jgi:hypothetical protein
MSKLRLEHKDGRTFVYDGSGKLLEDVVAVSFTHTVEDGPQLHITLRGLDPVVDPAEFYAEDVTTVSDGIRRYKKIEGKPINFREFT